ncbi:MAG: GNAT family N-acetyltransferase [Psychroflexus sp.]
MPIEFKYISSSETKDLRHLVLRQGKPRNSCDMQGDELKSTIHIGAFLNSRCVGVLSLFLSKTHKLPNLSQYQLRGMAVDPQYQRQNIGRELVLYSEGELNKKNVDVLWCNAREIAVGFYKKLNFEVISDQFQIADVGPHFVMAKKLT